MSMGGSNETTSCYTGDGYCKKCSREQPDTSKLNIPVSFQWGSKNSTIYLFLGNVQFASNDFCHFQFACMLRKHCCETVQSLLKEPR